MKQTGDENYKFKIINYSAQFVFILHETLSKSQQRNVWSSVRGIGFQILAVKGLRALEFTFKSVRGGE